ncbi:hypothetical protein DXG01_009916 [Tephrocybe rancida]|nr:hypothetical protein DXG01_009916 [Tephrocybe rancida]
MDSRYWDDPSTVEILFTILNFVACIPVLLAVGGFSTTIEGWEKDKVATMVRRGKLREVKFPYNLGRKRNIESILGTNKLLWCWPGTTSGNGLKFEMADSDDGPVSWPPTDPTAPIHETPDQEFILPSSPWTYENGNVNPNLEASNSQRRRAPKARNQTRHRGAGVSSLPPYHPDYQEGQAAEFQSTDESSDDEYDGRRPLVRTGSEGYEVRPVDREELLQRYLAEVGQTPGRYNYYIPTPDVDSNSDSDTPLAEYKID